MSTGIYLLTEQKKVLTEIMTVLLGCSVLETVQDSPYQGLATFGRVSARFCKGDNFCDLACFLVQEFLSEKGLI